MNYINELLTILNEMSTYLILGFLISGLLHVYVPKSLYHRFLSKKGFGSVVRAALLGVPLPLCSCGVIPTAVSLKKEGASDGATVSFLVATPQTGVDSILATYSLLGLPFAIIRPIISFIVAIFSGVAVDVFGKEDKKKKPQRTFTMVQESKPACTCGCGHIHDHKQEKGIKKIKGVFQYAFINMMQDFGKWLVVGLLIAGAITTFVPDSVFTMFKEYYFLNILLILVISTPMYICATGSIPIALSLILKGVTPGAAFVLLMAGPATNFAALIILNKEIGVRKTTIYLISIIIGAILSAVFIDFCLPAEWFANLHPLTLCGHEHADHEACNHGPIWWQTLMSSLFVILFVNSMILKFIRKRKAVGKH